MGSGKKPESPTPDGLAARFTVDDFSDMLLTVARVRFLFPGGMGA
jgi:hypothetical protein